MKITDWFKEIVKNKKELNLRIGAGVLATIMVAAGLSGCSNKKEEQEKEKTSVSDTMNEENKKLTFDNLVSSDLFLDNYDFDTEVSKTEQADEVLEYLQEKDPNVFILSVSSDFMRNYEIASFSEDNEYYSKVVSNTKKINPQKYKMAISINNKYSILTKKGDYASILNHETGDIHKIPYKEVYQINDSYLKGVIASNGDQTRYKLLYANGKEALSASYKDVIWDIYNEENVNILFLSSETYTDMVNLNTKEVKRFDNFEVTKTYSNYIIGQTPDHRQYVLSYDGFDISKIAEIERADHIVNFVLTETGFPNLIMYNPLMGKEYISTLDGKMLSSTYDEINGIANVGGHSTLHYYSGNISNNNHESSIILNSNGDSLMALYPEKEFCYGVFNDNIFLIEYKKENKKIAFKIEDGKIITNTRTGNDIELIANNGLFICDEDNHSIYAYDADLNLLETIEQKDLDRRNEVFLQMQGDKEQSKVKEKTMNNN